MFGKKGTGGAVKYGYRQVAGVNAWRYDPEPEHAAAPVGAGTVSVDLYDIDPLWTSQQTVFDLFVIEGKTRWCFENAEMMSETCFLVGGPPTRR
jgi:hypothetical protein